MGPDLHTQRDSFEVEKGPRPGHPRACPTVDRYTQIKSVRGNTGTMRTSIGMYLGAYWRHLANPTEPPVCGGDAALCKITLANANNIHFIVLQEVCYARVAVGQWRTLEPIVAVAGPRAWNYCVSNSVSRISSLTASKHSSKTYQHLFTQRFYS